MGFTQPGKRSHLVCFREFILMPPIYSYSHLYSTDYCYKYLGFRRWPHNVIQIFKESSPAEQGAGKLQNGLEALFCPFILKAVFLTPFLA